MKPQAPETPAIVVLEFDDGAKSGFSTGLHATTAPSRFQCIARDLSTGERLYVVAPVDAELFRGLLRAHGGNRYFMAQPALMDDASRRRLEALMTASEHSLESPEAKLVFALHIDTVPLAVASTEGVEARVSRALRQSETSELSTWADVRQSAVEIDWLDAIQARAEVTTPGPWRSYIEGRDHWGGADFIQTASDDFEFVGATHADQDFIAHARQDVPRLISEIRRLRRQLASNETSAP